MSDCFLTEVLGFNGFQQFKDNESSATLVMQALSGDEEENNFLNLNGDKCNSCSWESFIFLKDQKLHIQGFSGCHFHSSHFVDISKCNLFCDEKISSVRNGGSAFSTLTSTGKFMIFKIVCSSNVSSSDLSLLYELDKNCALAECCCGLSKYVVVQTDEKIVTISRQNNSPKYIITSELEFKESVKQISCGKDHNLILTPGGQIYSWGIGSRGQLGQGDLMSRSQPTMVEFLGGVSIQKIACGGWHSVALAETNDLYTWGWNESGQTGFPAPKNTFSTSAKIQRKPVQTSFRHQDLQTSSTDEPCCENATAVQKDMVNEESKKSEHNTMLDNSNTGEFEPVGVVSAPLLLELERYLAVEENDFISVTDVACGSRHTVAVTSCGHVLSWGWGKYGQLGQECCLKDAHGDTAKKGCGDSSHLPGIVKFSNAGFSVKSVSCGPWNTLLFGEKVS